MSDQRNGIVETLRGRILRGLEAGSLEEGDRLPSARDLVAEFKVDHRVILGAYRQLLDEGLVSMRARGGIYVAPRVSAGPGLPPLPEQWFVQLLSEGLAREIPGSELHDWLRRCTETLRLRATVISSTSDQVFGLCRELRDDFGLAVDGLLAADIGDGTPPPLELRRADLIVTTEAYSDRVRRIGDELRRPVITIAVRPAFDAGEWALLLRRPVYAVVGSPEVGEILRQFFEKTPGVDNLRIVVFGRDDIEAIPHGAPTYVTQRVREQLGETQIPGRVLPASRTIVASSAREIFAFIVRSNIEALGRHAR